MESILSKFKNLLKGTWSFIKDVTPIQGKVSPEEKKLYNLSPDYRHKFTARELASFYELFCVSDFELKICLSPY